MLVLNKNCTFGQYAIQSIWKLFHYMWTKCNQLVVQNRPKFDAKTFMDNSHSLFARISATKDRPYAILNTQAVHSRGIDKKGARAGAAA